MSNAEWMLSAPGTDQQKGALMSCVGCHTLERFMRSKHDVDTLMKVTLPRMRSYVNQSIPQNPQMRMGERLMEERGDQRVELYRTAAEYLSKVESQHQWAVELRAEAAAAPQGPRDQGDLHRIRFAARDHLSPRRRAR